jgi:hypothetical protein
VLSTVFEMTPAFLQFGGRCAVYRPSEGRNQLLKISIADDKTIATLKVEGKVVGPWAIELGQTWHDLWVSTKQKQLRLDISGVTFADRKGTQIFRQIVRATGAEILADTPLTQDFAKQARCETAVEPTEES